VLTTRLLHPQLLAALGAAGHGSQVLIADGNYPFSTRANPAAERVYLNLVPGVVDAVTVLEALAGVIPIEAAQGMGPDDGAEPAIFTRFRQHLPAEVAIERLGRSDFYEAARGREVCLVVATAEQELFANLLLTVGVRPRD
jgi:L-fucose mutarotase